MKLSIVIGLVLFCHFFRPSTYAQQQAAGQQKEITKQKETTTKVSPILADTLAPADTLRTKLLIGGSTIDQIEIDRLIMDETISKAGYDFIDLFNTFWSWPEPLTGSFIMIITERPYRGISTQLVISINDLVVFESFLQSRYDFLESLAEMAVEQTTAYLVNYEEIRKQLEGDDTKGTGIY